MSNMCFVLPAISAVVNFGLVTLTIHFFCSKLPTILLQMGNLFCFGFDFVKPNSKGYFVTALDMKSADVIFLFQYEFV